MPRARSRRRRPSTTLPASRRKSPTEIPPRGWWAVLLRVWDQLGKDNMSIVAAGCAFYAMLALFPAVTALVSIYGLIADPAADRAPGPSTAGFPAAGGHRPDRDAGATGGLGWDGRSRLECGVGDRAGALQHLLGRENPLHRTRHRLRGAGDPQPAALLRHRLHVHACGDRGGDHRPRRDPRRAGRPQIPAARTACRMGRTARLLGRAPGAGDHSGWR